MNIYITIAILLAIILLVYMLLKLNKNIRQRAYKLFLYAEHNFVSGAGESKLEYVVNNVYQYLPSIIRLFVSENMLKRVIQKMFDEIKDLLDDGKRNKSIERKD